MICQTQDEGEWHVDENAGSIHEFIGVEYRKLNIGVFHFV